MVQDNRWADKAWYKTINGTSTLSDQLCGNAPWAPAVPDFGNSPTIDLLRSAKGYLEEFINHQESTTKPQPELGAAPLPRQLVHHNPCLEQPRCQGNECVELPTGVDAASKPSSKRLPRNSIFGTSPFAVKPPGRPQPVVFTGTVSYNSRMPRSASEDRQRPSER